MRLGFDHFCLEATFSQIGPVGLRKQNRQAMKLDRSLLRIPSPKAAFRTASAQGRAKRWLQWLNLRPEESERTLLMFGFYTATSIGVLWLEASSVALFLADYGAQTLPLIYIAGALIATALGWLYAQLQRSLPLRQLLVGVAFALAMPLFLFRLGLGIASWTVVVVFIIRLWLEAVYVLNDLNNSIAANQLFNIRELKRTFPLISSGVLVADVLSGFSLPLVLHWVGIQNVLLLACVMMGIGAVLLLRLCQRYRSSFPEAPRRAAASEAEEPATRRLQGPLRRYARLLFGFFVLSQGLYLLVDFQFLNQLQQTLGQEEQIAQFLGLFGGVLGLLELTTQWFIASRLIERLGVFIVMMVLPGSVLLILTAVIAGAGLVDLFQGLVALKFCDELFRYTLLAGAVPVLFQAIPERVQAQVQALVRGVADPLATGLAGASIGGLVWLLARWNWSQQATGRFFALLVVAVAVTWLAVIWLLRNDYVRLLVLSAERGQLSGIQADLRSLKRALVEALARPGTEADKRSCIELLTQIDANSISEVLAPRLPELPPRLQQLSLELMLAHPNPRSLSANREQVRRLKDQLDANQQPEVLAAALRYLWLTEINPDLRPLEIHLKPTENPAIRSTVASLMLRSGTAEQISLGTQTLRQMLTHASEQERLLACRVLGDAAVFQPLKATVPKLLKDPSVSVRSALLEAIADAHAQDYYPSLLRGLSYTSTQSAARVGMVRLGDEILPALSQFAEDRRLAEPIRLRAWAVIGELDTAEAVAYLTERLRVAWGEYGCLRLRRTLLKILLRIPREAGIDGAVERLGRRGIEALIDQELLLVTQIYAANLDLGLSHAAPQDPTEQGPADLLARALDGILSDSQERLFLTLRLLYPARAIQAAAFDIQSTSGAGLARGLEILDNTLDLPRKRALLTVFDRCSEGEKLDSLRDLAPYRSLAAPERLRQLIELRAFLSDWAVACCFHLARDQRWTVPVKSTLACLRHPTGYVREAVLSYLAMASPRTLQALLPRLYPDPDQIVNAQVQSLMNSPHLAAPNNGQTGEAPHVNQR
ncbi:MFS transporter [Leptolyngbya sp. FACHB-261]|uniref:MFS transporter n=1 Tax=Leptolyngbya sp. FACHB-261 TaxID=2692806 RepID=UPI00168358C8|nr:MFS transporter [Leptolyngbya sp. FACHB-261]MBD2099662.1 MFS transporter [Leptolyngbya sp. FACHB-261]